MHKELLAKLEHKKKSSRGCNQGWIYWEGHSGVMCASRDEVMEAIALLDNKCKYNSESTEVGKGRENVGPLQN